MTTAGSRIRIGEDRQDAASLGLPGEGTPGVPEIEPDGLRFPLHKPVRGPSWLSCPYWHPFQFAGFKKASCRETHCTYPAGLPKSIEGGGGYPPSVPVENHSGCKA